LPLIDAARARGFEPQTAIMDKGFDTGPIHDGCNARGIAPVVPIKKHPHAKQPSLDVGMPTRLSPRIPRHSDEFTRLYRQRGALRVRGLAKVQLHADLTILARLAQALSRAREALPLAA